MSLKIEKLEDLLTINTDTMKSPDKSRLLTRVKQLIKLEDKIEAKTDEQAKNLPHEAIGIVGAKIVTVKYDLASKDARVVAVDEDETRVPVAGATALKRMQHLVRNQKGVK